MNVALAASLDLESQTCGECGISFAAPASFWRERHKNHKLQWYCPNGHIRVFAGETETERLTRELAAEKARAESWKKEADSKARSVIALRGQMTKSRKRASAGVCPCCQRTFKQLAAHMGNKHPDYATQEIGS